MRCEFRLPDGSLNLDLTTRILRRSGSQIFNAGVLSDRLTVYSAITGNNQTFRTGKKLVSSAGTVPPTPPVPGVSNPLRVGPFKLISGNVDGTLFWNASGTVASTVANTAFTYIYPVESWANESNTQYKDYMRIRDQSGKLLWSAGTLGDAVFRVSQLEFTGINVVKSYTSTSGKRLYVLIDETFYSGTYVEDEGGSVLSASGLQLRWRNGGTTVDMYYTTYNDNDIIQYFNQGNVSLVNIFEVFDGN